MAAQFAQVEEWKGGVLAEVGKLSGEIKDVAKIVGSEPDGNGDQGSGLAAKVYRIDETIGRAPNAVTDDPGEGMAKTVAEMHSWMKNKTACEASSTKAIQYWTSLFGLIIAGCTVLSGAVIAMVWLSHHLSSVAH